MQSKSFYLIEIVFLIQSILYFLVRINTKNKLLKGILFKIEQEDIPQLYLICFIINNYYVLILLMFDYF